jgi:5-carboxymethyl-2-hydroxymuconate isomerase
MPHFVIEYSSGLESSVDLREVMEAVYQAGVASAIMKAEDIKVRALPYAHYRLANPSGAFVHVTCRLLAGRTSEQKIRLSELVRARLSQLLRGVYSISVDVVDMDPDAYKKRLLDA